MKTKKILLLLSFWTFAPLCFSATTIIVPETVQASPTFIAPTANLVNSSGLSTPLNTGDVVPVIFPTHAIADDTDASIDNNLDRLLVRWGPPPSAGSPLQLTFGFGSPVFLDTFYLWNYAETVSGISFNNRGVNEFTLEFSIDGLQFFGSQSFHAAKVPDFTAAEAQAFRLSPISAEFVRMSIFSNQGYGGISETTGLGEIRFALVPEPTVSSLIALGVAVALFGFIHQRTRVFRRIPA